jgi:pyruvate ferredoxin oxidoreductase alpha subunit
MDGWVLTHSYERVKFLDQETVDRFLPPFRPANYLEVEDPKSWGSYADDDQLMEFKYSVHQAMQEAKGKIKDVFSELARITGRDHGGLIERYRTEGAEVVLVTMGSVSGTAKEAVDAMRAAGEKVGLVKIRCYRPFPHEDIWEAVRGAKAVAVMEATFSMGSEGAVGMDLKAKLCGRPDAPMVVDFIAGLGGREVNVERIQRAVEETREALESRVPPAESRWVGLNPDVLP